jgi:hypothetical protein
MVCEHPFIISGLSLFVIVGEPQLSVAEAEPSAASMVGLFGLPQMNNVVPVAVIAGDSISSVHVTILDALAVLLQPSMIDQDLVCERLQPVLITGPSAWVNVAVPHASVVVALPRAALIVAADGLHPAFKDVPLGVIVTVLSNVHVTVLEMVVVLLQPSLAVKVLVCERLHPVVWTRPSLCDIVGVPHPSVAVAEPSAAVIEDEVGLHPNGIAT